VINDNFYKSCTFTLLPNPCAAAQANNWSQNKQEETPHVLC